MSSESAILGSLWGWAGVGGEEGGPRPGVAMGAVVRREGGARDWESSELSWAAMQRAPRVFMGRAGWNGMRVRARFGVKCRGGRSEERESKRGCCRVCAVADNDDARKPRSSRSAISAPPRCHTCHNRSTQQAADMTPKCISKMSTRILARETKQGLLLYMCVCARRRQKARQSSPRQDAVLFGGGAGANNASGTA